MTSPWKSLDRELVRRALEDPPPRDAAGAGHGPGRRAAVAALLAPAATGVELLLIRRSERASDPWSGHMALPGGHFQTDDADLLATATRETLEEIGVDLRARGELLGRLDDLSPAGVAADLSVRPYVFAVEARPTLVNNHEVDSMAWADLGELASGLHETEYELTHGAQRRRFPGFKVGGHVVWGLTYRVVRLLLSRVPA